MKKKEQLSVEDKYMLDFLNQMDNEETNIDKTAKISHEFLLVSSIKDPKKVVEVCQGDGKTF